MMREKILSIFVGLVLVLMAGCVTNKPQEKKVNWEGPPEEWFSEIAEKSQRGRLKQAYNYRRANQIDVYKYIIRQLAEEKYASAFDELGADYYEGRSNTEQDYEKALFYFLHGAESGSSYSRIQAATMIREGKGTAPDANRALHLLLQAPEKSLGEYHLSKELVQYYVMGWGAEADPSKAHHFMKLAGQNLAYSELCKKFPEYGNCKEPYFKYGRICSEPIGSRSQLLMLEVICGDEVSCWPDADDMGFYDVKRKRASNRSPFVEFIDAKSQVVRQIPEGEIYRGIFSFVMRKSWMPEVASLEYVGFPYMYDFKTQGQCDVFPASLMSHFRDRHKMFLEKDENLKDEDPFIMACNDDGCYFEDEDE